MSNRMKMLLVGNLGVSGLMIWFLGFWTWLAVTAAMAAGGFIVGFVYGAVTSSAEDHIYNQTAINIIDDIKNNTI